MLAGTFATGDRLEFTSTFRSFQQPSMDCISNSSPSFSFLPSTALAATADGGGEGAGDWR